MIKKQKITPGSILEIQTNNKFYYAQILQSKGCAFFDVELGNPVKDFSILDKKDILFILRVYDHVITKGRWLKVGKIEIREELEVEPSKFIQDSLRPEKFELYDPNTGKITPATREEALGLERAAVWDAGHVEDRLKDHFAGKPNVWVKQLAIK